MISKTESKIQACVSLCGDIVDESHPNQDELRSKANNIESILIGIQAQHDKLYSLSTIFKVIEKNYENVLHESEMDEIKKSLDEAEK